jgi:xanthine dehydrogenase YagS FAD-binding subunit
VPQIRNVGTVGGNLCQRPRCWYFRGKQFDDCIRKGGNNCYAAGGENRYHAIYGAGACCMVHPSDLATALTALNAKVEIASAKGRKSVPIDKFYVGPDKSVLAETILTPQEMVVAVEIPDTGPTKGVFLKLKEREAFDFAIASVAINLSLKNNAVGEARVAFGGVAPFPMRAAKVEAVLKGKRPKDAIAAACAACAEGAQPLSQNAYKLAAVKGLLEAALKQVG